MRDDPTPPDSVGTVGDDHVRWASAVVDAKAKEHPFDCLVCGSKNVVLDIKTQHVRCRMCGVSTRNVYAHAVPNDRLREMEKLDADVATGTRSRDYDDVIVEEALQKVQEAKVVEEAWLREFHVESQNLEKLEIAAQERRRVALMRAKKAARGLDPNQTTLTPSLVYRHKTPHVVHSMASLPHYCMCYRTMHGPVFGSTNSKLLYDSSSCLGSNVTSDVPVVAMATMADSASPGPTPLVHPAKPSQPSPCLPENHRPRVYLGMANGVLRVDSVAIVLPEDDVKRNTSLPRQPTKPCAATSTELRMATSLTSIRRVAFVGQNAWLLLSDMQHTILLYAIRKDGVVESQLPTHALTCAKRVHVIATSPWLPHFCIAYGKNAAMEVVTMAQGYRRQQVPLTHKPTCVEFAAMGSQVAVGEKRVQHGVVRILNVETLQTNMIVATAHFGGIQFLRWIPRHHNFVFSLGHDHTIKLWDTAKKECVVSFQVHTSAPSDVLVTCNAAMECTITVSTFAKQIEKWTIGALQHLLHSVGVEHSYAIVLIQKQWRGARTRSHLR
ncbi:hypothetical protein DYB31_004923 [Aphanomyces astaci]|uniref:Uncharacterized protein n=1 Tax=Aphanomyces astaci TaxID=112090 RepID=A0A397F0R4_APHAT|nr:hypothetical protein DYB31_004923 [Aphanomyces astaci]